VEQSGFPILISGLLSNPIFQPPISAAAFSFIAHLSKWKIAHDDAVFRPVSAAKLETAKEK
jgi:hypothetical protein